MNQKPLPDTPLFGFLGKLADLVWLNVLTVLLSIPVLTMGTALTSCHYAMYKIRNDESYTAQSFWKGVKDNFPRTVLLLLILAGGNIITIGMFYYAPYVFENFLLVFTRVFVLFFEIWLLMLTIWVFPLQARFAYSLKDVLMNAFVLATRYPLRTLGMLLLWVPSVVMITSFKLPWLVVFLFLGISVPVYFSTKIYDPVFTDLKDSIREQSIAEAADESPPDKEQGGNHKGNEQ